MAFQWMSEPGMYSLLMGKVQLSERSGASALNFLVISSASAVATVLAGEGITRFGYPTVIRMTAALAFVAALLFGFLLRDVVSEKEGSKEITASSRTAGEASLSASAD
jgi:predicted MFS family arabinose efflux permease